MLLLPWCVSCAASPSYFAWKQVKQERRNQGHEGSGPTNEELTPGFIPVMFGVLPMELSPQLIPGGCKVGLDGELPPEIIAVNPGIHSLPKTKTCLSKCQGHLEKVVLP